jgi:hypothetical protein
MRGSLFLLERIEQIEGDMEGVRECETKRIRKKKGEWNLEKTWMLQSGCQYEHMLRSVHM